MGQSGIANDNRWYSLCDVAVIGKTTFSAHVTVDSKSPWFAGHFPGDAILPGVAQLGMILDLVSQATKENLCIKYLSRVKFKKIVRPGERLEISASATKTTDEYSFKILHETQEVCTGTMLLTTKRR